MTIKRFARVQCDNEGCDSGFTVELEPIALAMLDENQQIRNAVFARDGGTWFTIQQQACETVVLCSSRCLSDYGQQRARAEGFTV